MGMKTQFNDDKISTLNHTGYLYFYQFIDGGLIHCLRHVIVVDQNHQSWGELQRALENFCS